MSSRRRPSADSGIDQKPDDDNRVDAKNSECELKTALKEPTHSDSSMHGSVLGIPDVTTEHHANADASIIRVAILISQICDS